MLNKKSHCPDCGRSQRKNLGEVEILKRLRKVHGNKYEFEIPANVRTNIKIKFFCKLHGQSEALVSQLLAGNGCKNCGRVAASTKRALTTKQWVAKAKIIHGDKYDYSKTKYINSKTKVTVTCSRHGDFEINPSNHIQPTLRRGCKGCSGGKILNFDNSTKKLSQNEFLKRVKGATTKNLDFSKSIYNGQRETVKVICKIHGEFEAWPHNLFAGQSCPSCASIETGKKHRVDPIVITERLNSHFGSKYEIDQNSIKMVTKKIKLKCEKHGWFDGLLSNLLQSSGCPICTSQRVAKIRNKKNTLTKGQIIKRFKLVHGDRYDYSSIEPNGTISVVKIKCEKHGVFEQKVSTHFSGKGCPDCGLEQKAVNATLGQGEIYQRLIDLNGKIFVYPPNCGLSLLNPMPIICREHGLFYQPLRIHLKGNGCSECSQSLGAKRVSNWLREHGIEYQVEFNIPAGKKGQPLRADFFLPDYDLFIEYDGEQHFRPVSLYSTNEETALEVFNQQKERDKAKDDWIRQNGFDLLRIRFDQDVFEVLNIHFMPNLLA